MSDKVKRAEPGTVYTFMLTGVALEGGQYDADGSVASGSITTQ